MDIYSKLWNEEIRDKKRTARGVHGKTGKRGYVGKMMLTSDFLSGKEKREYTKSGKVRTYNMKDIMPYLEFQTFNQEEQKKLLKSWRDIYSNEKIINEMQINKNVYYDLVSDFSLKKKMGAIPKSEKITLTKKELVDYYEKMPEYEIYKYIIPEQQEILFSYHQNNHSSPTEFAEAWGVDPAIIYRLGSAFRNKNKQVKEKEKKKLNKKLQSAAMSLKTDTDKEDTNGLMEGSKEEVLKEEIPATVNVIVSPQEDSKETTETPNNPTQLSFEDIEEVNKMAFNIQDEINSEELVRKLNKLASFIEGENKSYGVRIEIRELSSVDKKKIDSSELIQQIANLVNQNQ